MSTCPQCGATFTCAMADTPNDSAPCWCTTLPALPVSFCQNDSADIAAACCYCPACLRAKTQAMEKQTPAK